MKLEDLRKPLEAHEIDFRIQSINKGGYATILAYKDARVDINRLDEVCTPLGWKREHTRDNANCIVSIWDKEKAQWVSKEDTGVQSYTEKEKGLASDSFKRACFNWGIGIELYDYPLISVKLNEDEFELRDGKAKQTWKLKLRDWTWHSSFQNGKLATLTAVDDKGKQRYHYELGQALTPTHEPDEPITQEGATGGTDEAGNPTKWLNQTYKGTTEITKEWKNVKAGIEKGKVKDIADVRKFYKVSKATEEELNKLFNK